MRPPFAWVGALAVLAACTGPRLVAYTPLEKKTELEEKKLYDAAEGTLLDRGYLLETRDEKAFRLQTRPRTLLGSQISQSKYKYVWIVETAGGTLKIQLKCAEAGRGGAEVLDCGKETPEKIAREQLIIAEQAIQEAKGD